MPPGFAIRLAAEISSGIDDGHARLQAASSMRMCRICTELRCWDADRQMMRWRRTSSVRISWSILSISGVLQAPMASATLCDGQG